MSAILAIAALSAAIAPGGRAAPARSPAASHFLLVLDGVDVGVLASISIATSSATALPPGGAAAQAKGAALALSRTIELQFGIGARPALFAWIADSWKGVAKPRNGAIIGFDASGKPGEQIDFSGATIAETVIPALDASSKAAGVFTLKLDAQSVKSGPAGAAIKGNLGSKQKSWNPANFRLEIDGIDTKRVSKIDAIKVTTKVLQPGAPAQPAFPPLKITSAASALQSWLSWQEQSAMVGGDDHAKDGKIELLSADLKTALATIELTGLGVTAIHRGSTANSDAASKFDAELYCDGMELRVRGK